MKESSRFRLLTGFLLCVHLLGLVMLSLFRLAEYLSLQGHISVSTGASPAQAFLRGVWFDNVVGCYILVAPLVVCLITATFTYGSHVIRKYATIFIAVLYILAFAVSAANIPYYAYFAKNINSSIFNWFGYVGTTAGMIVGETSYWLYICLFLFLAVGYIVLIRQLYHYYDKKIEKLTSDSLSAKPLMVRTIVSLLLIGLCVFGIRGRVGYNPIKVSEAYYCNDPFLNQLGIAPAFNLLTSCLDDLRPENQELHLMPYQKAIANARHSLDITGDCDSAHVLRRHISPDTVSPSRPNIIIILMESMSGAFLQTLGQKERVTPTLDSLYQVSWAFTNFYSAGIHTNHGITATLYSFPALMKRNLMKGTVTPRRQGLPTILKEQGYHNMFFMTHEAQYDNMNAFLHTNGYDNIYAQEDYPVSERVNAFGVSDHFLFEYGLKTINEKAKEGKPWMATLLTISNHPPYVIPDWFKPHSTNEEFQIVEYADWCIGDFLRKAHQQSWYKNTLFVILADHGKIVGDINSELPESYNHVPLIIFGPNVNARQDTQLATQVDVMPTILGLLGVSYDFDGFGINLSQKQRDMVFYTADDQIIGRGSQARYIYIPTTKQEFREGTPKVDFNLLKQYAFSMIQTAEFMQQHTLP